MAQYNLLAFFLLVSCRSLDENWQKNYQEIIQYRWENYIREAEKIDFLGEG